TDTEILPSKVQMKTRDGSVREYTCALLEQESKIVQCISHSKTKTEIKVVFFPSGQATAIAKTSQGGTLINKLFFKPYET
ncbi:MAG: hypothetical protein NT027_16750, partial [Proteobacteria bacterium]|nr:hypothetical protein [Pseudomonadota bacterium]